MSKQIYPSFSEAVGILLVMSVAGVAGLLGCVPYLIWKNEFTRSIGYMSIYLASFIVPSVRSVNRIKESGDSFSVITLFSRRMDALQIVLLIPLTLCLAICVSYVVELLHIPNFFTADIDRMIAVPVLGFVGIAILPAIFEELLLRGIVLKQFLKRYSPKSAILLSALLFGVMHINPAQILSGFLAGCFLGWVYFKTQNIKYCILIHFVNNSLGWMEYQLTHHFQQHIITKYIESLDTNLAAFCVSVAGLAAGIALLNKKYRENGSDPEQEDVMPEKK